MSISPRRKLAAGATGLAVLAGAGGAYAATNQSSGTVNRPDPAAEQKAFLDDLAGRLHVTRDQLDAAIKGAASDRIDAAVTAGRLTKDEADRLKQRIQQGNGLPLLGGPGFGRGGRPGPGFGARGHFGPGFGAGLDAAAKYLGLSRQQLLAALRGGKSPAAVAKDKGKTVDGLKAALKDAETAKLDQAVKDGKLTDAERTRIVSGLDQRLDDLVNRAPSKDRAFRRGPGGRWP